MDESRPTSLPARAAVTAIPNDSTVLAERLGVAVHVLEVVDTCDLTPSMRRVRLTADSLDDFTYDPGQDLMFSIPLEDGAVVRRRYTIRAYDAVQSSLTVDAVVHGDGPGARWATTARAGDRIEAIGPRGKITVDPIAEWHLFVGDDSFLPAAFAMAETVPVASGAPRAVTVVLEVDGAADEQPVAAPAPAVVQWVHREGRPPEDGTALLDALAGLALPPGSGHAYLGGEMAVVARLRGHLADRGMAREQLSPKPYWRAGVANAAHGEPDRD